MTRAARLCLILALTGIAAPAFAEPWASPGDSRLRSDFELVANAGLLDNITTQWPMPWDGVLSHLADESVYANQPAFVQAAARRLYAQARAQAEPDNLRLGATIDLTNKADPVRGFDAQGRGRGSGQLTADWNTNHTYIHLQGGALTDDQGTPADSDRNKVRIAPDGSYAAQRIGGLLVYAGYLPHWWGPGWSTALTLSTNARPFPQIGFTRASTSAPTSKWLYWIGAWRFEVLGGILNDNRVATNTGFTGVRFTINPLFKGLEIGFARTQILCGEGHPCNLYHSIVNLNNTDANPSSSASEGEFDIRYTDRIGKIPFTVYTQIMNEDSSPLKHSFSSHLVGATAWLPVGGDLTARVTAEYVSSISTADIFSFGTVGYGISYTDYKYPVDGLRYNGRAFGYSLDSDSRLGMLQASILDHANRNWTLTWYNAKVSTPQTGTANPLTTAPVTINIGEARVALPLAWGDLSLAARIQSDQLRPAHGVTGAAEAAFTVRFR